MNTTVVAYGRILCTRWRWIVWGVILAIAATAAVLMLWPPMYQSTATVFVRTPGDVSQSQDGGDLYAQTRAETYAVLARSSTLSARVIADLGLGLTPDQLSRRVRARHLGRSALLEVSVRAPSASAAQSTAEVLLNELSTTVGTLESVPGSLIPRAELVVIDPPADAVRIVAWGAPLYRVLIGAVLIGTALGALGAVIRAMTERPAASLPERRRESGKSGSQTEAGHP